MAGRVQRDISGSSKTIDIDVSGGNQTVPAGCRGIYVGVTGNVYVDMVGGPTNTAWKNLAAGVQHAMQISKVYQTGTTITDSKLLF